MESFILSGLLIKIDSNSAIAEQLAGEECNCCHG